MTTIELKNGYYIELDRLNYMLKRKCTGKDRNGAEKEMVKDLGYFGDIREAVLRFLKLTQADVFDGEPIGTGGDYTDYAGRRKIWGTRS